MRRQGQSGEAGRDKVTGSGQAGGGAGQWRGSEGGGKVTGRWQGGDGESRVWNTRWRSWRWGLVGLDNSGKFEKSNKRRASGAKVRQWRDIFGAKVGVQRVRVSEPVPPPQQARQLQPGQVT